MKNKKCAWCGNEVNRKGSKYCSTDCLYLVNTLRHVKIKLEKYNKREIKEIKIVDSKGEKTVKF